MTGPASLCTENFLQNGSNIRCFWCPQRSCLNLQQFLLEVTDKYTDFGSRTLMTW
jgi:hypothetical protein